MKKIIIINMIMLLVNIANAQWIKETPSLGLADFDTIRKITYVDNDHGWLITSYRLFRTIDGGKSWSEQMVIQPPSDKSFSDIKFFDSNTGVLVNNINNSSDLYKSSDAGNSWRRIGYSPNGYQFINSSLWFSTSGYTISKTTDMGITWTELIRFDWLVNTYFYDSSTGYAYGRKNSGEDSFMYYTYDGGITWNKGNISGINNYSLITNMQFTSKDNGFAVVPDSLKIIKTTDGGKNWFIKNLTKTYIYDWLGLNGGKWSLKFFNNLVGFVFVPPPYGYSDGIILRTLDGGETWEKYPAYGIGRPNDIFFSPVQNASMENTTLVVSAGQSFLKTSLIARIQKNISILSPPYSQIISSDQQISLKWKNSISQAGNQLVCNLYELVNHYSCSLISSDTVSSSQTELNKKVSINSESNVVNSFFYRVYNPNDINSEDLSEKFYIRIQPKITLQTITNSGLLFMGDSVTINFKSYAVDKMKIQYSIDSGTDWIDLSNTIQADSNKILNQNYTWIIPSTPGENCLLRIISIADPKAFVVSPSFKITVQKEIALFPLKKGNAWFYKHDRTNYGGGGRDAPSNIYYIYRTGDEIQKEDGHNYFSINKYIWDRNSGDTDKFNFIITDYYRKDQNKIYSYGTAEVLYDFTAPSITNKIFNRDLKTFRYGNDLRWDIIADSIGLIEFGSTAPVYAGYYERNYLVSAVINGVVYGDTSKVTGILKDYNQIPTDYNLSQNYPNPFNPATTITYDIPKSSFVTLEVYDILGRKTAILVNEEEAIGRYNVKFNGDNFSSGIYFYTIRTKDFIQTKKMILIK